LSGEHNASVRGKVQPRTGNEGPQDKSTALLFL